MRRLFEQAPANAILDVYFKKYRLFKKNPTVLLPCNPKENHARAVLGLHGNSIEVFLLKNLYCLDTWSTC